MTGKEFLINEATSALRSASLYDKAVTSFIRRADIVTTMLESLTDEETERATFLRPYVFIASA